MIRLKIDSKEVSVPKGMTVLAAARMQGVEVPSMCYREGKEHFTSCMICMVKDAKSGKLFPSCSMKVSEGMEVITSDEEVLESRKMALDLLLSEHVGDCEAPCVVSCPAHMDIPLMNRYLVSGEVKEAFELVMKDIPFPSVLGRICSAPCEGACRRRSMEGAVSICLLKRYAGDAGIELKGAIESMGSVSKRIAVIGGGLAGLTAAYYLRKWAYGVELFEEKDRLGGTMWNEVESGKLEQEVLEKEIARVGGMGVTFRKNRAIDKESLDALEKEFDAVLVCSGDAEKVADWGLDGREKVWVAGSAKKKTRLAIRVLALAKDTAYELDAYLGGDRKSDFDTSEFNSRFGKLQGVEIDEYMKESASGDRKEPDSLPEGFSLEEMKAEAARCLHCDCRSKDDCALRDLSSEYKAEQKRYWADERRAVSKQIQHDFVVFEESKCIRCGKCVHITAEAKEKFGMSFIGRGFDVRVGVPFGEGVDKGLRIVAEEVVRECPTGALGAR